MKDDEIKYRLTGGVFFNLFLEAVRPVEKTDSKIWIVDIPRTQPNVLFNLVKIVDFNIKKRTDWYEAETDQYYKSITAYFKLCDRNIKPFNDKHCCDEFTKSIKENYGILLQSMNELIRTSFYSLDSSRNICVVKNLLTLLEKDESIPDSQVLYVCEEGTGITKKELLSTEKICLQSFLLGMFHFAVTRGIDNKEGKSIIDEIAPTKDGGKRITKINLFDLYPENKMWPEVYLKEYIPEAKKELKDTEIKPVTLTTEKARVPSNDKELHTLYIKSPNGEDPYYTKEKIKVCVSLEGIENIKVGGFYKKETDVSLDYKCKPSGDMVYITFTCNGMKFTGQTSPSKWITRSTLNRCLDEEIITGTVYMQVLKIKDKQCVVEYILLEEYI